MIILQNPNTNPYSFGSGGAIKNSSCALPEIPEIAGNDICICDYIRCDYSEMVFASPPNPNDYWKNDKSEFIAPRFIAADTVDFELHKNGLKVADLNDNTYGEYFGGFANGNASQQLYKGYLLDWLSVYNAFGGGNYNVVHNLNIIGASSTVKSRNFMLALYSDVNANKTVRIETVQNGNIFGNILDFTDLNWYQSIRIKGTFGNPTPSFETTEYMTSKHERVQNKAKMLWDWNLETGLLSWEVVDKLINNKMLGNEILITDYKVITESIWRRKPVFMKEVSKDEDANTPFKKYNLTFTDVKDVYTKRNY